MLTITTEKQIISINLYLLKSRIKRIPRTRVKLMALVRGFLFISYLINGNN